MCCTLPAKLTAVGGNRTYQQVFRDRGTGQESKGRCSQSEEETKMTKEMEKNALNQDELEQKARAGLLKKEREKH
jgi:hypothetical protein